MVRKVDRAATRALLGDPVVTLARFHVPLDRLLPTYDESEEPKPATTKEGIAIDALGSVKGCRYAACGRVAEKPEEVLLFTVWFDQESLDAFKASPGYQTHLDGLGITDGSAVATIKFLSNNDSNSNFLRGWMSVYIISLPYPATEDQRQIFNRFRGPHWSGNVLRRIEDSPTRALPAGKGWAKEPREVDGQLVQDAILHRLWKNPEEERKLVEEDAQMRKNWDGELRELEPLSVKEEHVDLNGVFYGAR